MSQAQFDLHWIDYTIVLVYFMAIMAHGWHVSRKGKDTAHSYFLAGGALPWPLIGFSLYASNMSGSSFVGLMGGAYDNGMVIYNYEWTAAVLLVFFAAFILPAYLRAGIYTVPEFLEHRYSLRSKQAFSVFTVLAIMFIDTAGALYAGGLVITQAVPFLALWHAVALLALVAGLYTILGGLSAVVVTDTVQAILLIIGAGIIFVLGMIEIGGWEAMVNQVEPGKMELTKPIGDDFLPWPGLWGVMLLGFYYWTLNQFIVQRTLGARSLSEGRRGAVFAGFLKVPNLFLMILPGLIALGLYPKLENPDLAFPMLAFDLLPIGLRGLITAALIAAIMSSLDSALNAASTLVTMDFVKPMRTQTSDRALVGIGRVVTGVAMIVGAIYAPAITQFESLFQYFQSSLSYVVPPIVVVYLGGLFWRRATPPAAFWTIVVGLVAGVPMFIAHEVTDWWTAVLGLPAIHFTLMSSVMMFVGIALYVGISFATRQEERSERVERLIWSPKGISEELLGLVQPLWTDFRFQSLILLGLVVISVVYFW
jgi:SSS family solute:Na+ symporter